MYLQQKKDLRGMGEEARPRGRNPQTAYGISKASLRGNGGGNATHTYTHPCIYIYMHVGVYIYAHIYMCMHTCIYI